MCASPVWEKITTNGKPFGHESEEEKELKEEIVKLKEEIELLKKENEQLQQLFEEETPKKK
jgi:cell shape-determining protein MreC